MRSIATHVSRPSASVLIAGATAVDLAWYLRAMYRFTGRPGGVLDDAYIHFQFATTLAQGHPFEWTPGGGYSTGATSVLWPVLLAPGYWLGFREERLALWAAALGAVALWTCAWCTYRILGDALGSPGWGALGAALVLTSGPLSWGCFGGMEVPLVAVMAIGIVRAVQTGSRRTALILAALLPLARPEWTAVTVAVVLRYSVGERRAGPVLALAPLTLYLALNLALTGRMATSGAVAKSLWYDPELTALGAARTWAAQGIDLVPMLLAGSGLVPFGTLVLAAIGTIRPSPAVRWAALSALIALLATVTVADPFRQEQRYQIPALPLILVAVVAGAAAVTSRAGTPRGRRGIAVGFGALLLGSQCAHARHYNDALAYGCRDIHGQQVTMGRWMRDHLPRGSRIALNDAGAIPLYSGLPAIDLDLFGPVVHKVSLSDNRTCGEPEKFLFEARWDALHSGDRPLLPHPGIPVDEVDVADLESEGAHDYEVDRPARTIYRREPCQGTWVAEGGRVMHAFERMRVRVSPGRDAHLVWRTDGGAPGRVRVLVDGRLAGSIAWPAERQFVEPEVPLPASLFVRERPEIRVELEGPGEMSSFHYWVFQ